MKPATSSNASNFLSEFLLHVTIFNKVEFPNSSSLMSQTQCKNMYRNFQMHSAGF